MGFLFDLFKKKSFELYSEYNEISSNGLPKFLKKYFSKKAHEYLVITADTYASELKLNSPPCTNVAILGYINLTTGERCDEVCSFTFIPSTEERKNQTFKNKFEKFTIYKIKALTAPAPSHSPDVPYQVNSYFALFSKIFFLEILEKNVSDAFLESLIAKYKEPVILNSKELGDFKLNKIEHCFKGKCNWLNNTIDVSVCPKNIDESQNALHKFEALYKDQSTFDENARKFIAKHLTPLINKRRTNDPSTYCPNLITETEFARTLQIKEISVGSNSFFSIYYKDDPYFCGQIYYDLFISYNLDTQMIDLIDLSAKDGGHIMIFIDSDGKVDIDVC